MVFNENMNLLARVFFGSTSNSLRETEPRLNKRFGPCTASHFDTGPHGLMDVAGAACVSLPCAFFFELAEAVGRRLSRPLKVWAELSHAALTRSCADKLPPR
ncbi:hypothetical protein LNV08_06320 [Paucibacter sp. TC2R-5]|uniref:hypothetical protein n=1 Tax=Paucibacter sp. TC2R-5 TaxID=2893555 RepID=UPI0021E47406|nr:hypothetical protein [Paucibacter sp. TC2R-5]MCV2358589.1 hypothetical protein [Paucibacter sp. TC2R-5]